MKKSIKERDNAERARRLQETITASAQQHYMETDWQLVYNMAKHFATINAATQAGYHKFREHAVYFETDTTSEYYAPKCIRGLMEVAAVLERYHDDLLHACMMAEGHIRNQQKIKAETHRAAV